MGAGVGGLEAGEDLGAHGGEAAGIRAADDGGAAVAIGVGLAGADGIFLGAEFKTGGELERRGQAGVERGGQVEVGRNLVELQLPVVEGGRAGVAERDVGRIGRAVINGVGAVVGAQVPVPVADLALDADADGDILDG